MKLWGSVRQGAAKVAFEADKMVRIRKQEGAIADVQKQVQAEYTALGEQVIGLFQAGMIDHPQVAIANQTITGLTAQIAQLTAELENTKADQFTEGADPSVAASSGQPASTWTPPPAPVAPVQPVAPVAPIAPIAPVAPVAETKPCPHCGAIVSATGAFCPECGQSLRVAP